MLTTKQREMLVAFERDLEADDFDMYNGPVHLAWANRERVIDALYRKGFLDGDGITDAGRKALGR